MTISVDLLSWLIGLFDGALVVWLLMPLPPKGYSKGRWDLQPGQTAAIYGSDGRLVVVVSGDKAKAARS